MAEKSDSSTAMASLAAMYTESDHSDDDEIGEKEVDKISDDEAESSEINRSRPNSAIPNLLLDDDANSRTSLKQSTDPDEVSSESRKRRATKLVSYGGDDIDEDPDAGSDIEDQIGISVKRGLVDYNVSLMSADLDSSSLSRSVLNRSSDEEIQIPSEPTGKCSGHLQAKIAKLYEKMRREGLSLTRTIQNKKEVRNPSIYEKLIEFCSIDEKGTNYPPEIYDPHLWSKHSYYDALDKVQKAEMEKREKERKDRTKVEFVVGTKKTSSEAALDDKKRKSKWDALPNRAAGNSSSQSSATSSAAPPSKTTIISAVGNIMKKAKQ